MSRQICLLQTQEVLRDREKTVEFVLSIAFSLRRSFCCWLLWFCGGSWPLLSANGIAKPPEIRLSFFLGTTNSIGSSSLSFSLSLFFLPFPTKQHSPLLLLLPPPPRQKKKKKKKGACRSLAFMASVHSPPKMADFQHPLAYHHVNRKPLPQQAYSFQSGSEVPLAPQQLARRPSGQLLSRGRTPPSAAMQCSMMMGGGPSYAALKPPPPMPPHASFTPPPTAGYPPIRRPSSGTTSTTSTGNNNLAQQQQQSLVDVRRSSSSRSAVTTNHTPPPVGYVALMRRQKATVWCDRSQPEDPRIRAQKLADKKRAYREINVAGRGIGIHGSGRTRNKERGTTEFTPSTLVSAVVPVRLSANEVPDDADDEAPRGMDLLHRRPGSGRSSLGSNRYPSGYQRHPSIGTSGEKSDLPEVAEKHEQEDRPDNNNNNNNTYHDDDDDNSIGSEPEENFGTVGEMSAPSATQSATQRARRADELKRSGSVDDRTTSLTGVRLFVANPDLSD